MLMKIIAVMGGIVVALTLIGVVQSIGHAVYPPPADLNIRDAEAFAAYRETLPAAAILFVLASYLAGAFAGPFVAGWLAGGPSLVYAALIGGVLLALTVMNLVAIPHPIWFSVLAILGIPAAAFFGGRLAPTRIAAADRPPAAPGSPDA